MPSRLTIHALGKSADGKPALLDQPIAALSLLGSSEKIIWTQDAAGLHITLPANKAGLERGGPGALKLMLR